MPIRCKFKPEDDLVIFVHSGIVPDEEFLESYKDYHNDPRFDRSYNLLVDLRKTESSERSPQALKEVAEFRREFFKNFYERPKVAIIAPNDISFGLARVYEAYSDVVPENLVVFRAADAALAWLGVGKDLEDELESLV